MEGPPTEAARLRARAPCRPEVLVLVPVPVLRQLTKRQDRGQKSFSTRVEITKFLWLIAGIGPSLVNKAYLLFMRHVIIKP